MIVHIFKQARGSRKAITLDKAGVNLPAVPQPWIYEKQMTIDAGDGPRIGASSADIIAAIEADGIFIWPTADIA